MYMYGKVGSRPWDDVHPNQGPRGGRVEERDTWLLRRTSAIHPHPPVPPLSPPSHPPTPSPPLAPRPFQSYGDLLIISDFLRSALPLWQSGDREHGWGPEINRPPSRPYRRGTARCQAPQPQSGWSSFPLLSPLPLTGTRQRPFLSTNFRRSERPLQSLTGIMMANGLVICVNSSVAMTGLNTK